MSWPTVALGEIFQIARGGSPRPIDDYITDDADGVNWVSIRDASNSSKFITKTDKKIRPAGVSKSRMVYPGDFLLTNSMSFGRPYILQTTGCIHDGWLVLRSDKSVVDQDFFYHLLGSEFVYKKFAQLAAGAVVKNLNCDLVKTVQIPLPPLPEQRRIAAILDKADALRARRREAIAKLDQLLQSVFLDMFGDPVTNPRGWPSEKFGELCRDSFRNGLSPSSSGSVPGEVLTLTAITGPYFDFAYRKNALFDRPPSPDQMLSPDTFLICRGNGNKNLVGAGAFADRSSGEVSFPDTMIGATIDESIIGAKYLETVWRSRRVREQIESGARTTNGTFKVNQSVLGDVRVPLPPVDEQMRFGAFAEALSARKKSMAAHSTSLDALFASTQQSSFAGA